MLTKTQIIIILEAFSIFIWTIWSARSYLEDNLQWWQVLGIVASLVMYEITITKEGL